MDYQTGQGKAASGPRRPVEVLASTHEDIRDRYLAAQVRAEEALERARTVLARAQEGLQRARATRAAADDTWRRARTALIPREEIDGTDMRRAPTAL